MANLTGVLFGDVIVCMIKYCSAKHRDMLVTTTESAILNEVNLFYQKAEEADHAATEETSEGNSTQNSPSQ
eukprot:COSAG02_NODE_5422_length_4345_cov_3.380593_2_plen_71_part_00